MKIKTTKLIYLLIVAGLIIGNTALLIRNAYWRSSANDKLYDLPNIGLTYSNISLDIFPSDTISIPSPTKRGTIIYFASSNTNAVNDIRMLLLFADTDIGSYYDIVIVYVGLKKYLADIGSVCAPPLLFAKRSSAAIKKLGRQNPKPNTFMLLVDGQIQFEGPVYRKWLLNQLAQSVGEDISTLSDNLSAGTIIDGLLIADKEYRIEELAGYSVLFLFSTYCGSCGTTDIYNAVKSIGNINAMAVFPDIYQYSTISEYYSSTEGIDIPFILTHSNTVSNEHFMLSYPTIVVLKDNIVQHTFQRTDGVSEIIDKIIFYCGLN